MSTILEARELTKTFRLSSKQQKLERTKQKVRIAVDRLSFSVEEGEISGLLGPKESRKQRTLYIPFLPF